MFLESVEDYPPQIFPEEKDALKEMGARIQQARKKRRLTQAQLGAITAISATVINRVEGGRQSLAAWRLARVAQTLRVSSDALLGLVPLVLSR